MKKNSEIFHRDFKQSPFWWEAFSPTAGEIIDIPQYSQVVIVGGGYCGLASALQLNDLGIECCVLEAKEPGSGASTRSGGLITASGGIKTPLLSADYGADDFPLMIKAAQEGLDLVEQLITQEEIECEWHKTGFLKLANTRDQLKTMSVKAELLSQHQGIKAQVLTTEQLIQQIGSHYYRGGLLTEQAAHLHPSLYYQGLLSACLKRGIPICSNAKVTKIIHNQHQTKVITNRGNINFEKIIIATNGYTTKVTPQFQRRLIPIKPYIIATEILDDDLANDCSPQNRSFAEAKRIAPFFRLTGLSGQQRMIFGSRVKWKDLDAVEMAPFLYKQMTERFVKLKGVKITHAWSGNVALTIDERLHTGKLDDSYYALGCNGSGVANMTYMGAQVAKKVAELENYSCPYDTAFPDSRFYNGKSSWFVPLIGRYLQCRDWLDSKLD